MKNTTLLILLSLFIMSCGKNGEYIEYYKDGQISSRENYKDNKRDGIWTFYYKNGNKFKEEEYKNGILDGKVIGYFKNGLIGKEGFQKNGKKDGEFIYYNEDGSINRKCVLKNGLEWSGKFIYKDSPSGFIDEVYTTHIGEFKDGEPHGKWTYYNEDGSIDKVDEYKDGELIN